MTPEGQSRTKKPRAKKPKAKKPGRRKGSEEDGQTNWKLRNQICPVYEKPKLVRHTWRISLQGGNRAGLHRLRDSVAGLHRRRRRFRFIYAACFHPKEASRVNKSKAAYTAEDAAFDLFTRLASFGWKQESMIIESV